MLAWRIVTWGSSGRACERKERETRKGNEGMYSVGEGAPVRESPK